MNSLLVVTDDKDQQRRLSSFFSLDGYSVSAVSTVKEAVEVVLTQVFDVAVLDLDETTDITLLKDFLRRNSEIITILAYTEGSTSQAVSLVNSGAFESVIRPCKLGTLYNKVEKAVRYKRLSLETQNLRGERDLIYWSGDLIGNSSTFRNVLKQVHKVSRSDSSIVLLGESGTGKEVIAGIIHYNSLRSSNAFVRVNCAALHEELLETELFGHEKGAFTGAVNARVGRFEHANEGTIFLDEIGDMSLRTQAKVLRVLQEKEFERVGSNRTITANVRVLSATNKDLQKEIAAGRFREDLYYRLNVVTINLPSLRERKADILPLALYFLGKFAASMKKEIRGFNNEAERALINHNWPGNIRELKNCIERAMLFTENEFIGVENLALPHSEEQHTSNFRSKGVITLPDEGLDLEKVERELIYQALEKAGWVQKRAAELLGVSPRVLNYKIKRFSITHDNWIVHSDK